MALAINFTMFHLLSLNHISNNIMLYKLVKNIVRGKGIAHKEHKETIGIPSNAKTR